MGIELYWDDEAQTTLLMEVRGHWTWDDLYTVLNKVKKVTDNATFEIGAILDASGGLNIPGGSIFTPTAMEHAKRMLKMGEGGTGPVVIVGANNLIRTVYNTISMWDRKALSNVQFADTLEEARALLEKRRQHLMAVGQ